MNAAFVFRKRDCDQDEHHDEHNPLFAFRELKDSEQALHRSVLKLRCLVLEQRFLHLGSLPGYHSERSEESQSFLFTS